MLVGRSTSCELMGNVNSLVNKGFDRLELLRNQGLYLECSLLCFMETWLNDNIPGYCVDLLGFIIAWTDRGKIMSLKSKGEGLILLVNNRWFEQYMLSPHRCYSEGCDLLLGYWTVGSQSYACTIRILYTEWTVTNCRHCCLHSTTGRK